MGINVKLDEFCRAEIGGQTRCLLAPQQLLGQFLRGVQTNYEKIDINT